MEVASTARRGRLGPIAAVAFLLALSVVPGLAEVGGPLEFLSLSPNGGETFPGGSTQPIAWTARHAGDTLFTATVAYTFNASRGYPYFVARGPFSLPSDSFPWRVPTYNATTARVQVCGIARDGDTACISSAADFTILATPPYLDLLSPADGSVGVGAREPLVLGMDEVDLGTLSVTTLPAVTLTPTWDPAERTMTYSHAEPFAACTVYGVSAQAQATDGTPLGPYSWTFQTPCGVYILWTSPADGESNVSLDTTITMEFSGPMNIASTWIQVNPMVPFVPVWTVGDRRLTLISTTPLSPCTTYTIEVGSSDLVPGPAPNPWSFSTVCHPHITATSPAYGEIVSDLLRPIQVWFSVPMDSASLSWTITPNIDLTPLWTDSRNLTLLHTVPFASMSVYTVQVSANDTYGRPLVPSDVPNPWSFSTSGCTPYIVMTSPYHGQAEVPLDEPLVIYFCRPMDPSSVTVVFSPPVTNLTFTWYENDSTLRVDHDPYRPCTMYTVSVSGRDKNGVPLIAGPVPNPWSFWTLCTPVPPMVSVEKAPPDTVRFWIFQEWWDPDFFRIYESEGRFAPWPWTVLAETPFDWYDAVGHLNDGKTHFYIVRGVKGTEESGNSSILVKAELAFDFNPDSTNLYYVSLNPRSQFLPPIFARDLAAELTDLLLGPNVDALFRWNPADHASVFYAFFRGAWRGTDFPLYAGDAFWLGTLRPFSWAVVGTGVNVSLNFTAGQDRWISLQYTSLYRTASDIVLALEGSLGPTARARVAEVVTWDAVTQSYRLFSWTPSGWSGDDFELTLGMGIRLSAVGSFTWNPQFLSGP